MTYLKDNPAKWTDVVLDKIEPFIEEEARRLGVASVLDPFAGTGKIHRFQRLDRRPHIYTRGVEIEPEWAAHHLDTEVGDALDLRFGNNIFSVVATSPVFGNRMSDHHDAQEKCRACKGSGLTPDPKLQALVDTLCPKCEGEGRRHYKRNTYRHMLGRVLTEGSSAALQWGPSEKARVAYQKFHVRAWREVRRVLRPGGLFILNISDHVRGGEVMPVSEWHKSVVLDLMFRLVEDIEVSTPRNGFGANRDLRVDHEHIYVFRG